MEDYDRIGSTAMMVAVASVSMLSFAVGFISGVIACIAW